MTKTLSFAALFLAATCAATASLTSVSDGHRQAAAELYRATSEHLTQRGTLTPLDTRTNDAPAASAQPRRGERLDLTNVDIAMSSPVATGARRGLR
jgi:hypothetical protein